MKSVFGLDEFVFPYQACRFPGQASDERILYVARESVVMLYLRLLVVLIAGGVLLVAGLVLPGVLGGYGLSYVSYFRFGMVVAAVVFWGGGWWWVNSLWKKSLFILTNRRLTKFIYTTPWNRYNLSLGLDQVVDTGAYARGYFQALLGIGTFTARSSAGNRQDKYFFIENVYQFEDLANYVNKVLFVFNQDVEKLNSFRPFLPWLKGKKRKDFMKDFPGFWS